MSAAAIEALIILGAKYGPGLVLQLIDLFKKPEVTPEDLRVIFARLQPYAAFGIPEVEEKLKS